MPSRVRRVMRRRSSSATAAVWASSVPVAARVHAIGQANDVTAFALCWHQYPFALTQAA